MVFDFTSGQDLCTGSYFTNAIPVVRSPFPPPKVDVFYINIADRAPDHQAGIPPCRLAQHHLRLRDYDKKKISRFRFSCTNLVCGWPCYRTAKLPRCNSAKCVYPVSFRMAVVCVFYIARTACRATYSATSNGQAFTS